MPSHNSDVNMQADNTTAEAGVSLINQEWNPDDDGFVQEVVLAGIVLFVIGVAVLAAFFIYYMVRCVCWTCLGDVRISSHVALTAPGSACDTYDVVASLLLYHLSAPNMHLWCSSWFLITTVRLFLASLSLVPSGDDGHEHRLSSVLAADTLRQAMRMAQLHECMPEQQFVVLYRTRQSFRIVYSGIYTFHCLWPQPGSSVATHAVYACACELLVPSCMKSS